MTPLEQAKIDFTDALIEFEKAQQKLNEAKQKLLKELADANGVVRKG